MRLDELERSFQARVIAGTSGIEAYLAGDARADVTTRLGIYLEAYVSRIVAALGKAYPATRIVLGAGTFGRLAAAFLREVPSTHPSIRDYGSELGGFLARQLAGERGLAIGELADWEWMLADVFDARDGTVIAMERLTSLPPEQWVDVRFVAHPTLRRVRTGSNAVELWRGATGAGPAVEPRACESIEWMAWRCGFRTLFRSLDAAEAAAIDLMRSRTAFGTLCERLAELGDPDSAAPRAAAFLRTWLEEGLIADLTPGE
jgi:Putative DNA-binding domain